MPIRNIIFDLGGVFIDIHYDRTRDAFERLGVADFDALFRQTFSNPLFAALETGTVSPDDFYNGFRNETGLVVSNEAIAEAWNAMLGSFRPASIQFLQSLKGSSYQLFLLSNTNQIHYDAFSSQYAAAYGGDFDMHFEKAYYSHLLGYRKPDVACYRKVLDLHGLEAAESLFIDDTLKNIEGANTAGLQTLHLANGALLEMELPNLLS